METDKPFTSPLIEELKKHLDSITREEFMQNMAAMRALFKAKENETDNNPLKLKVGKSYYLRHMPSGGSWELTRITHFTRDGFPWGERPRCSGIVTDCYEVQEYTPTAKLFNQEQIGNMFHEYLEHILSQKGNNFDVWFEKYKK